ncbi:MAG: hypothetical protein QOK59_06470 [Nitrososphaeraceae archaeon]|nr:hypothetical protein [Nitrososphaeraceae archaeon]MDW0136424.1 hypothetical protein [Nitrososphaeraceae archaeon]MDW0141566.1 hypothetical protein [Nitrososphaeraceae archaeon]MDW0144186.1 hypothetical protein [Nitrososphaeraceae archaeon]MDW0145860.1 hypothetical protein [Nitrososphaeraceae archaeon]
MNISSLKNWLPIVAISAVIPIIISLILGISIIQALVASGLTIMLVISAFIFRSHGQDRKPGYENS